jgi:hypothetical protein
MSKIKLINLKCPFVRARVWTFTKPTLLTLMRLHIADAIGRGGLRIWQHCRGTIGENDKEIKKRRRAATSRYPVDVGAAAK